MTSMLPGDQTQGRRERQGILSFSAEQGLLKSGGSVLFLAEMTNRVATNTLLH